MLGRVDGKEALTQYGERDEWHYSVRHSLTLIVM
jgi:hypothetical protein